MSFFNKLFGGNKTEIPDAPLNTSKVSKASKLSCFGRYTDINKNKSQLAAWKNAIDLFKSKKFTDSFEQFLTYLKDDKIGNVSFTRAEDTIHFEIIQGSKIIRGQGDSNRFFAEASICIMPENSIPVMRKLMTINYSLRYSKFALKDNKTIVLKFSSHTIDASPEKLYDALKELGKKADQQDDLLLQEFSSLQEVDTENIIEWAPEQKDAKYNCLHKMIADTKAEAEKLDSNKMSGGIAYLLLSLTYKIDYLIVPQGKLTDSLEKIQFMFFAKNDMSTQARNTQILEEYKKITNMSRTDIMDGIYDVKCTFALANPATHKTVMDFMFKEREKIGWYRDNKHPNIVAAVYEYMISYSYFNYGMVYPVTQLLNIVMSIMNRDYYEQCGSKPNLINEGTLEAEKIAEEINNIIVRAKINYPKIALNTSTLNYTSVTNFADSLLLQIDKLNLLK